MLSRNGSIDYFITKHCFVHTIIKPTYAWNSQKIYETRGYFNKTGIPYAKGRKTHPMISEIEQNVNLFKMQGIAGDEREYN